MASLIERADLLGRIDQRFRKNPLQIAWQDLKLSCALIVVPGAESYPLTDWPEVINIRNLRPRIQNLATA
jgi:hypothetical protein